MRSSTQDLSTLDQIITDIYPESAWIHGRLNANRLCALMDRLYRFFQARLHLVPEKFHDALRPSATPHIMLIVTACRASGRRATAPWRSYIDSGRGQAHASAGRTYCHRILTTKYNINPDLAEQHANAIIECEQAEQPNTLTGWLLKHAITLETLRDTITKTIDLETALPAWQYSQSPDDHEALTELALQHYRLIRYQQGFSCVSICHGQQIIYQPTTIDCSEQTVHAGITRILWLNTHTSVNQQIQASRGFDRITHEPSVYRHGAQIKAAKKLVAEVAAGKPITNQQMTLAKQAINQAKAQIAKSPALVRHNQDKGIVPAYACALLLKEQGYIACYSAQTLWTLKLQVINKIHQETLNPSKPAQKVCRSKNSLDSGEHLRALIGAARELNPRAPDNLTAHTTIAASSTAMHAEDGESVNHFLQEAAISNFEYSIESQLEGLYFTIIQAHTDWHPDAAKQLAAAVFHTNTNHVSQKFLQVFWLHRSDAITAYALVCDAFARQSRHDKGSNTALFDVLQQERNPVQLRLNVSQPHLASTRYYKEEDRHSIALLKLEIRGHYWAAWAYNQQLLNLGQASPAHEQQIMSAMKDCMKASLSTTPCFNTLIATWQCITPEVLIPFLLKNIDYLLEYNHDALKNCIQYIAQLQDEQFIQQLITIQHKKQSIVLDFAIAAYLNPPAGLYTPNDGESKTCADTAPPCLYDLLQQYQRSNVRYQLVDFLQTLLSTDRYSAQAIQCPAEALDNLIHLVLVLITQNKSPAFEQCALEFIHGLVPATQGSNLARHERRLLNHHALLITQQVSHREAETMRHALLNPALNSQELRQCWRAVIRVLHTKASSFTPHRYLDSRSELFRQLKQFPLFSFLKDLLNGFDCCWSGLFSSSIRPRDIDSTKQAMGIIREFAEKPRGEMTRPGPSTMIG